MAGANFCGGCGAALAAATAPATTSVAVQPAMLGATRTRRVSPALLGAVGVFVGGLVGFQMRPAVMFIGQLPFQTVVTRGSGLSGIDQLLISTAQQSFNVMLVAAVMGGVIAFGLSHVVNSRR
jgi:hypothetical protein